jgi:2-polyprenyl-3-methyl-5-hydroxy-6-metoxy-1,4-benzoquinol methylase
MELRRAPELHLQGGRMKEPILEPLLRRMRMRRVLPYVRRYPQCTMLDIGCGWEARLLRELEAHIGRGVGIDFKAPNIKTERLETISAVLKGDLPFKENSFDLITMLAVLEHLEHPEVILKEIARLLRPGGGLLITVPSWYAKPVLEFLAYRMGIVNPDEIRDHKRYFNREDLFDLIRATPGLKVVTHEYFQWRFNNLLFVTRTA